MEKKFTAMEKINFFHLYCSRNGAAGGKFWGE
jgi:hypothetical protein